MKATGIVRRIDDLGRVVIYTVSGMPFWDKAFPLPLLPITPKLAFNENQN